MFETRFYWCLLLTAIASQYVSSQSLMGAVVKVLALEHGVEQVAVGTVYKDMKLKPTALKEYTEDITMAQQLAADSFCDDEDGLVLEDETARIKLTGQIDVGSLVTGTIIGVRGVLDEKAGVFVVEESCFAGGHSSFVHSAVPQGSVLLPVRQS